MKQTLITIAAVVLVGCASGYYTEYNDIKSQLLKTPNIDIIQMGGNKDLTYEDIWAEINVKGKGRITVFALSRESFKKTPKIVLGKIGDYDIRWEGEGDYGSPPAPGRTLEISHFTRLKRDARLI